MFSLIQNSLRDSLSARLPHVPSLINFILLLLLPPHSLIFPFPSFTPFLFCSSPSQIRFRFHAAHTSPVTVLAHFWLIESRQSGNYTHHFRTYSHADAHIHGRYGGNSLIERQSVIGSHSLFMWTQSYESSYWSLRDRSIDCISLLPWFFPFGPLPHNCVSIDWSRKYSHESNTIHDRVCLIESWKGNPWRKRIGVGGSPLVTSSISPSFFFD